MEYLITVMDSDESPPTWRSYSALFRDSRINVDNLYRHLSGLGLGSLQVEVETVRGIGRTFASRVAHEIPGTPLLPNIYSSLHQLERAIDAFEQMIYSGHFEIGIAKDVCDSIQQQYSQLQMFAASIDRGSDYLV